MAAEPKRKFYLLNEDGKPTTGSVGYINAVSGQGEYLDIDAGGLEIDDPGVLGSEDFNRMLATPSHPLSEGHATAKKKEP
jgi:hypothetical protein